jgi:hypothetical protein
VALQDNNSDVGDDEPLAEAGMIGEVNRSCRNRNLCCRLASCLCAFVSGGGSVPSEQLWLRRSRAMFYSTQIDVLPGGPKLQTMLA